MQQKEILLYAQESYDFLPVFSALFQAVNPKETVCVCAELLCCSVIDAKVCLKRTCDRGGMPEEDFSIEWRMQAELEKS